MTGMEVNPGGTEIRSINSTSSFGALQRVVERWCQTELQLALCLLSVKYPRTRKFRIRILIS
ncbi:hypothetical protein TMatcc_000716 [Talaromyces marneffei ATCC 18224]